MDCNDIFVLEENNKDKLEFFCNAKYKKDHIVVKDDFIKEFYSCDDDIDKFSEFMSEGNYYIFKTLSEDKEFFMEFPIRDKPFIVHRSSMIVMYSSPTAADLMTHFEMNDDIRETIKNLGYNPDELIENTRHYHGVLNNKF